MLENSIFESSGEKIDYVELGKMVPEITIRRLQYFIWLHKLKHFQSEKSSWTKEQDEKLMLYVLGKTQDNGRIDWRAIDLLIPGKTMQQCIGRYSYIKLRDLKAKEGYKESTKEQAQAAPQSQQEQLTDEQKLQKLRVILGLK